MLTVMLHDPEGLDIDYLLDRRDSFRREPHFSITRFRTKNYLNSIAIFLCLQQSLIRLLKKMHIKSKQQLLLKQQTGRQQLKELESLKNVEFSLFPMFLQARAA